MPVIPVVREEGSGARRAMEVLVMDGHDVTPRAVLAASPQGVVDYVASHKGAVGYVSWTFLSDEVVVLRIDGLMPTPNVAELPRYPLVRDWVLVYRSRSDPTLGAFLNFCLSPAGQELIGRQHGRVR
jgi:phosphate transport system substrate-binding protein